MAIAVAIVASSAGYAVAARPGSEMIRACADRSSGVLRILGTGKRCGKSERALRWNRKGLRGPMGARGSSGADGVDGTDGSPGTTGAPGAAGTAKAYAAIAAGGTVDAAHSQGIASANVQAVPMGIYCISGLSFTPNSAVATLTSTPGEVSTVVGTDPGCSPAAQVVVYTFTSNGGSVNHDLAVWLN